MAKKLQMVIKKIHIMNKKFKSKNLINIKSTIIKNKRKMFNILLKKLIINKI